MWVMVKNTF